jgi:hypothetical protein
MVFVLIKLFQIQNTFYKILLKHFKNFVDLHYEICGRNQ